MSREARKLIHEQGAIPAIEGLHDKISQLQAENERLRGEIETEAIEHLHIQQNAEIAFVGRIKQLEKAIESYGNNPAGFDWTVLDRIEQLQEENKKLQAQLAKREVFIAYNRTSSLYFNSKEAADIYAASGGATAGIIVQKILILGDKT